MGTPAASPAHPEHEPFLLRTLELARAGVAADLGGPFGALVVRDGKILAEGENRVLSSHDPTAHAEVIALRAAATRLGTHELLGCTLYASCEPCPMCLAAAWWSRVERIVFAATRHDAAAAGFDDAAIYDELTLPLSARRLPMLRLPLEAASRPFADWLAKEDRRPY